MFACEPDTSTGVRTCAHFDYADPVFRLASIRPGATQYVVLRWLVSPSSVPHLGKNGRSESLINARVSSCAAFTGIMSGKLHQENGNSADELAKSEFRSPRSTLLCAFWEATF